MRNWDLNFPKSTGSGWVSRFNSTDRLWKMDDQLQSLNLPETVFVQNAIV